MVVEKKSFTLKITSEGFTRVFSLLIGHTVYVKHEINF